MIKNTLKIAIAAIIAIVIAYYMNITFYISSGIVTILTIQSTKKDTIYTALERLLAFLIALVIAYICFQVFDYTIVGFACYLFFYIFICQYFKWYSSMAMNSVLISHFLTFQVMNFSTIYNEIVLFVIGVGIGILANLHLRKNIYIEELKLQADDQIKYILQRMSKRIVSDVDQYDGHCFDVLYELIAKAKTMSIENEKNSIFSFNSFDREYIRMRSRQTQVLYEMYKNIRLLKTQTLTSTYISQFLDKVSKEYHLKNDCKYLIEDFYNLNAYMKSMPLPCDRNEFEDRARLFSILVLLEEFLLLKRDFYNRYCSEL